MLRGWWSAIVLSFAVVRGWWPAIVLSHLPPKPNFTVQNERFARFYHLPWSGVGGLLLSYHLLWSGVGGQLLFYHMCHQNQISQSKTSVLRDFIICRGLGLVVCYCLIICCGQGLVICHQTILPQFRTSNQHEVTRGLQNEVQNSHFTSVLDVR